VKDFKLKLIKRKVEMNDNILQLVCSY